MEHAGDCGLEGVSACQEKGTGRGPARHLPRLYGVSIDTDSPANVIPLDHYGNRLHLGLAAGMTVLGVTLGRSRHARSDDAA